MDSPEYWLISVPNGANNNGNIQDTWSEIKQEIASNMHDHSEIFHFDVPELRVGTLDKLMNSSDQLAKIDMAVESIIRKIERTFEDVNVNHEALTVDGEPVLKYIQQFRWSSAKYPNQRPIDEILKMLSSNCAKVEDELKEATVVYQEKKQLLAALERKKGGNLMVVDLHDILTPAVVSSSVFVETEYLTTVPVVVPKTNESDFLASYESLAGDAVGYGPEEDRNSVLGSPVVPRSAHKLMEDKEGYCLFLVTVLKKYVDMVRTSALSQRFMVREFTFDPNKINSTQDQLVKVEIDSNQARNQLLRWCKTHYGEALVAWIHTKALRLFVESVLRYGLPVDFLSVLVKPHKKSHAKKVRDKLFKMYSNLDDAGMLSSTHDEKNTAEELYPYVNFNIKPLS